MAALIFTFVTLHFILGVVRSDGNQSLKRGDIKVKSCENDEQMKSHKADSLFDDNANQDKARIWRRLLVSKTEENTKREVRRQSEMLYYNSRQKWQPEKLQQSRKQEHGGQNSTSKTRSLGQKDISTNRTEQWLLVNQKRRDRASFLLRQEAATRQANPFQFSLLGDNQFIRECVTCLRPTGTTAPTAEKTINNTEKVQKNNNQVRENEAGHDGLANARDNVRSLDQSKDENLLYRRRRTSQAIFVTESTSIYPFVEAKQALDYLTSYDSLPVPTKWPIKMILPENEHEMPQGQNNVANIIRNNKTLLSQGTSHSTENTRFSRSPLQVLQSSEDAEKAIIHTDTQQVFYEENGHTHTTAPEAIDVSAAESTKTDNQEMSKQQTITMNDAVIQNVTGAMTENESILTKVYNYKSSDEKRGQRMRQQTRKRNNKLRRQRKRRKQNKRERGATTTSTYFAIHPITSTYGSAHVTLAEALNRKRSHRYRKMSYHNNTSEVNKATTIASSLLASGQEVADITTIDFRREGPVTGAVNKDFSKSNIFIQSKEHLNATRGTTGYNNQNNILHISESTKQISNILQDNLASKAESETKKDHRYKFDQTTQNGDINDNHMFNSLKPALSPTPFFAPDNGKTLSNDKQIQVLFEKCSEENTNDSRVNTGLNIRDRNSPKHVRDHTNPGPDRDRVITIPDRRWPVAQVICDKSVRKKEDSYKSADRFSAAHGPQVYLEKSMKNSATEDKGNTDNSDVTNAPETSSNLITIITPHITDGSLPKSHTSQPSSARQWRDRLRQKQRELQQVSESEVKRGINSKDKAKDNRRGSLAAAFSKPPPESSIQRHTEIPHTTNGNKEQKEDGPFIDYKTAYDFLSNQKGPKMNVQNEARREGNELNRFMGEGMCEIFNKHYVPTRIGGKCE